MKRIRHAMILAAGLGTRLRPFTDERPKPLIEVLARPLLELSLEHALAAGAQRVAINSHWLHPKIPDALGDSYKGMALLFSHEPEVLGTGGGLKKMSRLLDPEDGAFLVLNADALIDLDVEKLLATHFSTSERLATLVLKAVPDAKRYGAIGTDAQGRVLSFAGRTQYAGPVAQERMFCGVHILEPALLEWLTDEHACCVNKVGYPRILDQGLTVLSADHTGAFWDVGTPERLLGANLSLLDGTANFAHLNLFAGLQGAERTGDKVWIDADASVDPAAKLVGPLLIAAGAAVAAGACVGPRAVVGQNATLGASARLEDLVVLSGTEVDGEYRSGVIGPRGFTAAEPEAL